jgi:hypothetical protein
MKASQFVELLRKMIREEVTKVVRNEMGTLIAESKQTQTPAPRPLPKRTTPLVHFDDSDIMGSLLNETKQAMSNPMAFGEEEIDPEFGVSSADTRMFVKDYSSILKRSNEISNGTA